MNLFLAVVAALIISAVALVVSWFAPTPLVAWGLIAFTFVLYLSIRHRHLRRAGVIVASIVIGTGLALASVQSHARRGIEPPPCLTNPLACR